MFLPMDDRGTQVCKASPHSVRADGIFSTSRAQPQPDLIELGIISPVTTMIYNDSVFIGEIEAAPGGPDNLPQAVNLRNRQPMKFAEFRSPSIDSRLVQPLNGLGICRVKAVIDHRTPPGRRNSRRRPRRMRRCIDSIYVREIAAQGPPNSSSKFRTD
jgi:hypothetical protein